MSKYSLTFVNNSTLFGNFCIYLKDPQQEIDPNLFTLAWLVRPCYRGTRTIFSWDVEYGLTWSESGKLGNGKVDFTSSETRIVDPSDPNKNALGIVKENGAYRFTEGVQNYPKGALGIRSDHTIPVEGLTLGITMSGQPAFALPASPNYSFCFEPHLEYWAAFGNFIPGEVIDVNTVSSTAKINFPFGEFDRTVTFNEDNTWTV